ncbi:MAG: fatty acid desaturase [Myxococcales bacterium]|nr:fatty acid desaturase [Myxococcales bacterium]
MTDRALIDATRPFAVEHRRRSWAELVLTVALLSATTAGALLLEPWPLALACSLGQAAFIVRLFMLYHDFLHGALLRGSALARVLFTVYGLLVLTPTRVWRQTHNYHHAHNSKIIGSHVGSFPVMTVAMWRAATPRQRLLYRFVRSPLNVLLAYVTIFAWGMCLSSFLRRPRQNWDSLLSLLLHVALVGLLAWLGGPRDALFGYVIPLALACMAGAYLFYVQHNYEGVVYQPRESWSYGRAALESSSFLETGPIVRWLTANIGYHHVHHLNPTIPFYRLPEAMASVPALQSPGRTSLKPSDIAACFRLKLWDPEAGRMVGFTS